MIGNVAETILPEDHDRKLIEIKTITATADIAKQRVRQQAIKMRGRMRNHCNQNRCQNGEKDHAPFIKKTILGIDRENHRQ